MKEQKLTRSIGLLQASAINMIDMVGIGPFVVMSLVAERMGHAFLYAWIAGAILSLVDAMVWSQFGATFPMAGGSYQFLKAGYGEKAGKLMSFLYVWQTMIQAPLVIASAAVGFAQYTNYLFPLTPLSSKLVSVGLICLIVLMLYRKIETIGKISVWLWVGVLFTMASVILGGFWKGDMYKPLQYLGEGIQYSQLFAGALGFATVKTVYSYLGYYNVCHLGGEITNPTRNIPRSMFISIGGIAVLYLLMNCSVASVLPFQQMQTSQFVVSAFIQTVAGKQAANVVTVLILWVAFASVFSATLGYSRVPYAAAVDGAFFPIFGKLHPTKQFPYISLLFMAGLAVIFSITLPLKKIIPAILAMRILIQFIAQAIGLLLLVKRKGLSFFAWQMPLYPLPVILAILIWMGLFVSTGNVMMLAGGGVLVTGIVVYCIKAWVNKEWPFL